MWGRTKKDLNWVFKKLAGNAGALSPDWNICTNESFNLVVVSKIPKMHRYSKSESLALHIENDIGEVYMVDAIPHNVGFVCNVAAGTFLCNLGRNYAMLTP